MIFDLHCHLTAEEYNDLDNVVERAKDILIVSSGLNFEDNKNVLEICRKYKNVKAGFGLYPVDALNMDDLELERNLKFIEKNKDKCLYVGECGLDYKDKGHQRTFFDKKASPKNEPCATDEQDREKQKEVFLKCIKLAEKIKKPLLIHSRKAEEDCVEILENCNVKNAVFHCFTGDFKLVKRIEGNGWGFSIPASVVRDGRFQRIVKNVDVSRLFTETDAPFLSPFSFKKEKALGEKENRMNEPSFVVEGLKKIAEIKKLEVKEVENILYMNFQRMFL